MQISEPMPEGVLHVRVAQGYSPLGTRRRGIDCLDFLEYDLARLGGGRRL